MSVTDAQVFWLTGLSGAGKTTLVNAVAARLRDAGKVVRILDGDVVRRDVNPHLGFTPADIRENNRIIAELCVQHRGTCDYIFVPVISPFEDSRQRARDIIGNGFFLVHLKVPLATVMARDVKGLYKKALAGEIPNFIGIDPGVPYEEPAAPDLVIDAANESEAVSIGRFLQFVHTCA